jgi:hypothetical protein
MEIPAYEENEPIMRKRAENPNQKYKDPISSEEHSFVN